MKKNILRLTTILTIMAILLLGVSPALAAEKTAFQCTESFITTLGDGLVNNPDGNIHIRSMIQLFDEQSSEPRFTGKNTVVVNANWRADFTGPMWGTFRLVTAQGGWEGTWAGQMTEQGPKYNAIGDGFGDNAGMKLWVNVDYGVCTGEILGH
jgi:hypothetical protein